MIDWGVPLQEEIKLEKTRTKTYLRPGLVVRIVGLGAVFLLKGRELGVRSLFLVLNALKGSAVWVLGRGGPGATEKVDAVLPL